MNTETAPNEIDSVTTIYAALEKHTPETRDRILQAVSALFGIKTVTQPLANSSPNPPTETDAVENTADASKPSIALFIKGKRPSTVYQRLACLGYYLEHFGNQTQFNAKDLAAANSTARQNPIPDLPLSLMHTTSVYGFFAPCGGGKKQLTTRGEAVVNALPDESAVKAALTQNPIGNSKKRKSKKD